MGMGKNYLFGREWWFESVEGKSPAGEAGRGAVIIHTYTNRYGRLNVLSYYFMTAFLTALHAE